MRGPGLDRYSDTESRLDIMQRMMEWRHMVPTAPDTLTSLPFPHSDPFLLQHCPHVFFAGNQPEFGQRLVTGAGCRLMPVTPLFPCGSPQCKDDENFPSTCCALSVSMRARWLISRCLAMHALALFDVWHPSVAIDLVVIVRCRCRWPESQVDRTPAIFGRWDAGAGESGDTGV